GILYAAFLLLHDLLPTRMGIALIVESLLPWTGVFLALVLLMTPIRFSWLSVIGLVIPALVWTGVFGRGLLPNRSSGDGDLKVATHKVGARTPQPTAAAQSLVDQAPDIVTVQALETLSGKNTHKESGSAASHAQVPGTNGVW